jgi:hypothetical protein
MAPMQSPNVTGPGGQGQYIQIYQQSSSGGNMLSGPAALAGLDAHTMQQMMAEQQQAVHFLQVGSYSSVRMNRSKCRRINSSNRRPHTRTCSNTNNPASRAATCGINDL